MKNEIQKNVQEKYGRIAKKSGSCCRPNIPCGCSEPSAEELSSRVGYSPEELRSIPDQANMGLGCGNPVAFASLEVGQTVLDLGSGGGIDCFLAARKVGPDGRVIGVDMTPEMIHLARENKQKGDYSNVDFRLGEIENLPVADHAVDVAISNCVINLSPNKERVFQEIFRVLKPGGWMMVSDIILTGELPEKVKQSMEAYTDCIAGALPREEYLAAIRKAGFIEVKIVSQAYIPVDLWSSLPLSDSKADKIQPSPKDIQDALRSIASIKVHGKKEA